MRIIRAFGRLAPIAGVMLGVSGCGVSPLSLAGPQDRTLTTKQIIQQSSVSQQGPYGQVSYVQSGPYGSVTYSGPGYSQVTNSSPQSSYSYSGYPDQWVNYSWPGYSWQSTYGSPWINDRTLFGQPGYTQQVIYGPGSTVQRYVYSGPGVSQQSIVSQSY